MVQSLILLVPNSNRITGVCPTAGGQSSVMLHPGGTSITKDVEIVAAAPSQ